MNKSDIDMHLLVDRFLAGALCDDKRAEFEERLVWDKDLLEEVHLAEQLRDAMKVSAESRQFEGEDRVTGLGTLFANLFAVPQYAAAASFLVAVALTSVFFMNPQGGVGGTLDYDGWVPDTVMETVSYQLFSVRGSGQQALEVEANTWTVFEVDAVESCARDRATIRSAADTGESFTRQLTLKPNFQQVLAIGLPTEILEVGPYVLDVEGIDARAGMQCDHSEKIEFEISAKN